MYQLVDLFFRPSEKKEEKKSEEETKILNKKYLN